MAECPVFHSADLIGKKWTVVLMQEIRLNGDKGFNAISRRMGKISPKLLSQRLKDLEDAGVIKKETSDGKAPLRTSYRLTKKGEELNRIIADLKKWNVKYHNRSDLDCFKKDCVKCALYLKA